MYQNNEKMRITLTQKPYKNSDRILLCLFALSVFSNYTFDLSKDYYIIGKVFMCAFIVFAFAQIFLRKKLKIDIAVTIPFLFLVLLSFSYFWAYDKSLVLAGIKTQSLYFLLFCAVYYVVKTYNCLELFFSSIFASGFGLATLSIIKYGGFGNYINSTIQGIRLGGMLGNENIFGMAFATAALVSFYYILTKKKRRLFYIFALCLFSFFALSSQSKKCIVIIALGVALICTFHWGIKKVWKSLLVIIVALALFMYILHLDAFSGIYNRLMVYINGTDTSDQLRMMLILKGMQLFSEKPLFGFGYDNYIAVANMGFYSHNNFVELLVNLGIVGLLLYYSMYIKSAIGVSKYIKQNHDERYKLLLVLLLIDLVIGYGAVQYVEKTAWITLAVYLSASQCTKNDLVIE